MQVTDVENRFVVAKGDGSREGCVSLGLADANYPAQNEQQGPTVWHRALYSVSRDKPSWKGMWKRIYAYLYIYIIQTESLAIQQILNTL